VCLEFVVISVVARQVIGQEEGGVVKCMGIPQVLLDVLYPYPAKTLTHSTGMGFCRGSHRWTLGLPRPIPVGMYPWVLQKKTYFARQKTILAPFVIF